MALAAAHSGSVPAPTNAPEKTISRLVHGREGRAGRWSADASRDGEEGVYRALLVFTVSTDGAARLQIVSHTETGTIDFARGDGRDVSCR